MTDTHEVVKKIKHYQGLTTLKSLSSPDERLKFHKTMEEVLELLHDLETVETLVLRLTKVIKTSSQVITCKDCRYYDGIVCKHEIQHRRRKPDWYCADVWKRKEQKDG